MTADDGRSAAPAHDCEPTHALEPGAETTHVLVPADEHAPTVHLAPDDEHAPATRLAPGAERPPVRETLPNDAGYSATVLASHWIQRPEPDDTLVGPPGKGLGPTAPTRPDRIEGTVLRFGPGVTAAAGQRTNRTPPTVPPAPAPLRRGLRRHTLPALALICVIAFLAWQHLSPTVGVRTLSVTVRPTTVACDGTADIVGRVTTNGRPGTLSYRWSRSDGTASAVLRETVPRGQRQARLHLLWTFQGKGHYRARAELHIVSPDHRTVATRLTYECP
ncbi:hypothetical protein JK361_18845 [Streptomyces sp. 5-8]|uniref:Ig-like domain-containing protein n=1 Tax=Streptomyces musisoli TaxID=2802280 RepID=A0ABS1P2V3_9ACTN|nr:hypothetical protein [Streptomyces musisoli]MBL1106633.1 hypothetical protein [Streptomyces musisoli]